MQRVLCCSRLRSCLFSRPSRAGTRARITGLSFADISMPATLATFNKQVQDYAGLRSRLEKGLPPLQVTENADEIEAFERASGEAASRCPRDRRTLTFFHPAMRRQIRWLLVTQADASDNCGHDGGQSRRIRGRCRTKRIQRIVRSATMPPKILLLLPDLPRDIEYRFVGRHLILLDVRANMIIDDIPYALRCRGCLSGT